MWWFWFLLGLCFGVEVVDYGFDFQVDEVVYIVVEVFVYFVL